MSAPEPTGRHALAAQVGVSTFAADWTSNAHRARRLVSEFIGVCGLTFILSGGASIIAQYGGEVPKIGVVAILSAVSALWLVAAIYFLGDISAHFNPAMTLAFALRGDMGWVMALAYWVVQFAGAVAGTYLALWLFGNAGGLASVRPQEGLVLQALALETILTFGMVLLVLGMANGPKLNGQYVPLAVGAYIFAWGTMGGTFDGAAMNPARAFGPDLAAGALDTYWVYLVGGVLGAVVAVGVARFFRGRAKAQEASAAMGDPLA
jgi:aquaporin Z